MSRVECNYCGMQAASSFSSLLHRIRLLLGVLVLEQVSADSVSVLFAHSQKESRKGEAKKGLTGSSSNPQQPQHQQLLPIFPQTSRSALQPHA